MSILRDNTILRLYAEKNESIVISHKINIIWKIYA